MIIERPQIVRLLKVVLVSYAALVGISATTYGQGSRHVPVRDTSGSERTMGALENESRNSKRDAQTILTEVNDDFARLRVINGEIKQAISPTSQLNFKALSDNGLEIKKRGTRLRGNLAALPKAEKEDKQKESVPADEAQIRTLLTSLNAVMDSFLTNPVFSDLGTIDNQLAARARRDLDHLIVMSDVLKNGAEKLSKRKH